jgi:hypothetical protein
MKLNILVSWVETICAPQLSLSVVKLDGSQQKRYMKVFSVLPEMTTPPQEECLIRPIICTIKPQLPGARPFGRLLGRTSYTKALLGIYGWRLVLGFTLAVEDMVVSWRDLENEVDYLRKRRG